MWRDCPHKWKLTYVDKASPFKESINFLFGTAMHEVLQEYIKVMFSESIAAADELDLKKMLLERMKALYVESKEHKEFSLYTTKEEMAEFYGDGCEIIDFFKKHRGDYFSKRGYTLVGVEVPLNVRINDHINFNGFLDVVIRDDYSGKIKIFDFKTSARGWMGAAKKNENKISQLVLYKNYFSQQYNVPVENIDVMFLILKRKLFEKSEFPQKRFQKIEPASGRITIKKVMVGVTEFLKECFDEHGNILTKEQPKLPSPKNCQYCEFKTLPKLCDRKK